MAKSSFIFKDLKTLGQFRDELKVQTHLFKLEVKNEWEKLEYDWKVLQRQLSPPKKRAKKCTAKIKASTQQFLRSVKLGSLFGNPSRRKLD